MRSDNLKIMRFWSRCCHGEETPSVEGCNHRLAQLYHMPAPTSCSCTRFIQTAKFAVQSNMKQCSIRVGLDCCFVAAPSQQCFFVTKHCQNIEVKICSLKRSLREQGGPRAGVGLLLAHPLLLHPRSLCLRKPGHLYHNTLES